jgi:hypothetical protein
MTDADDPRTAEPVAAPPYEEEPSTTGVVVEGDEPDEEGGAAEVPKELTDQQAALQAAVDAGDAEGSAASGA